MDVTVRIRLEPTPDGVAWWATVPEVHGLVVTDESLQGLISRATFALHDVGIAEGIAIGRVAFSLEPLAPSSANPSPIEYVPERPTAVQTDVGSAERAVVSPAA